ncbi:uncharacterized protein LOC132755149 [Ruditapes philippinarum]|uniref:uncharacterized protein LOC132755149 n=1 Tax=Ruditapes philippinarum TaxID=129788 RepID=UPI00295B70E6|nr:uncharacterized protein LOC132755149 [Ruditapes philippinarum]
MGGKLTDNDMDQLEQWIGSVYGGYVQKSWKSSGNWTNDTPAFLYQLRFNGNDKRTKFPIQSGNSQYALFCNSTYGPLFGSGHDLRTFQNTVNSSGTYFALDGQMNIGNSYDNQGVTTAQINNGNMNVTELEYLNELTEDIVSFKPIPDLKVTDARILIIGPVGAGKSSFFNTINSIFRGRITQKARSGSAEQSLTTAVSINAIWTTNP